MTNRNTTRLTSFVLAVLTTCTVFSGIDTMALSQHGERNADVAKPCCDAAGRHQASAAQLSGTTLPPESRGHKPTSGTALLSGCFGSPLFCPPHRQTIFPATSGGTGAGSCGSPAALRCGPSGAPRRFRSGRVRPALTRARLTITERWICAKRSGSSSSASSRMVLRISASPPSQTTSVYFSSERRNTTCSTGIRRTRGADRGLDPLQPARARSPRPRSSPARRSSTRLERAVAPRPRACGARRCLQALHRVGQARLVERLDQVVDRALLEGLHGVLLVGGDEHDLRAARPCSAPRRCPTSPACARRGTPPAARGRRTARPPRGRCAPEPPPAARATGVPAARPGVRAAAVRRRRSGRSGRFMCASPPRGIRVSARTPCGSPRAAPSSRTGP